MEITLYSWELLELEGEYFVKRINACLPSDPQSWVVYSLNTLTAMSTVFAMDKQFVRRFSIVTFDRCFSLDVDYEHHRVHAKININLNRLLSTPTEKTIIKFFKNHICAPITMSSRKRNIGAYVTRAIDGPPTWDIYNIFPEHSRMWGYNLI